MRREVPPSVTYTEAGVTLARTPLNGYEARTQAGVVFRAHHTGALSSDIVLKPGDCVEEVKRIDSDIRKGGKR